MSKWSLFFLLVPIGGVAIFAAAPFVGWDLPQNVSTFGRDIDALYYGILAVTGIVFIGTQLALCYVLLKFGDENRPERALYTHGSRKLEVLWTVIPAITLLFIALYQMPAWIEVRFPSSKPDVPPIARVIARQFEWRMIYPGPDGDFDTVDDVHVANELHLVKGPKTLIDLRSMDVLHSFFLPNLRVKQDAVPGLAIPVWFDAKKSTREYQAEHAQFAKPADLADLGGLALKIRDGKDALSTHLRGKLSESTKAALKDYTGDAQPTGSLAKGLIADLNQVISGPAMDKTLFEGIKESRETRELQDANEPAYQALINRQRLTDAFPNEVGENKRHYELVCAELCGWGHYKMKGRIYVHDTREDFNAWLSERAAEQEASK